MKTYRRGAFEARIRRGAGWDSKRLPRAPELDASASPPPLGDIVETIASVDVAEGSPEASEAYCGITETKLLASYNWLDQPAPKIIVSGKPPLWTPPSRHRRLLEDSGVYYRDRNAALYPDNPLEPAVVSIMKMHADPVDVDVVACASTLGNLLRFIRGEGKPFRMLVEVVGITVHLVRRENSPKEQILGIRGYGHTFPEAYTTWESDVRRSYSHQRVLKYRFGGLELMVRFEGDGYIKPEDEDGGGPLPSPSHVSSIEENVPDMLENLRVRPAAASHPVGSSSLQVADGGQALPQEAIFELKTRSSIKAMDRDTLDEQLPRLWIAQISKFILAYHERGLFEDVRVQDVRNELQAWEKANQSSLRRLAALLRRVIDKALEEADVKLEIVAQEGGLLEIRKRLPDAGNVFSEEVRRRWLEWLGPRGGGGEDGGDSDSDSDSEDDFTACDEECGYCGKCHI